MTYEITWEPTGILFRFSGIVSDDDLVQSNKEVYANPLFATAEYEIADFSSIEAFAASPATVREVTEMDREAAEDNPDMKVAIIASTPFMRGMSNMYAIGYEAAGGSWATRVVETEEDARAWVMSPDGG